MGWRRGRAPACSRPRRNRWMWCCSSGSPTRGGGRWRCGGRAAGRSQVRAVHAGRDRPAGGTAGGVEDQAEADLALGRHGRVAGELEALVAADPLRERLHQPPGHRTRTRPLPAARPGPRTRPDPRRRRQPRRIRRRGRPAAELPPADRPSRRPVFHLQGQRPPPPSHPPAQAPGVSTLRQTASWLDAERANLHAATDYAAGHGRPQHAIAIPPR